MLFVLCRRWLEACLPCQRADAVACAMLMFFPLSAPAFRKLHLSRNLISDLPSWTVGPDPACHIHVCGNKSLQA